VKQILKAETLLYQMVSY